MGGRQRNENVETVVSHPAYKHPDRHSRDKTTGYVDKVLVTLYKNTQDRHSRDKTTVYVDKVVDRTTKL